MARRGRGRRTREMVRVAKDRIDLLMREAEEAALAGRIDLADRYVEMARNVGMRYNVRVPPAMRRRFCRSCYRYLLPGVTSRTRTGRGRLVTTCLRCGHVMRVPLRERRPPVAAPGDGPEDGEAEEPGAGGERQEGEG